MRMRTVVCFYSCVCVCSSQMGVGMWERGGEGQSKRMLLTFHAWVRVCVCACDAMSLCAVHYAINHPLINLSQCPKRERARERL